MRRLVRRVRPVTQEVNEPERGRRKDLQIRLLQWTEERQPLRIYRRTMERWQLRGDEDPTDWTRRPRLKKAASLTVSLHV